MSVMSTVMYCDTLSSHGGIFINWDLNLRKYFSNSSLNHRPRQIIATLKELTTELTILTRLTIVLRNFCLLTIVLRNFCLLCHISIYQNAELHNYISSLAEKTQQ